MGHFLQKILLVRRELDKCIFQVFLSKKYFLRKLPTFLKNRQSSFWCGPAYYYDSPSPLAPCRFLQARAQSRISQSVWKRCACPSPFPFPGLCSSIHPKRERFGPKRMMSKYLRNTTKWGTDVSLRVRSGRNRARVLAILVTFLFPDSLTKWAPRLAMFCTLPDPRVPDMLILDDLMEAP